MHEVLFLVSWFHKLNLKINNYEKNYTFNEITLLMAAMFMAVGMNAQLLDEGFDDITTLTDWDQVNASDPLGTTDWFQGGTSFDAFDGPPTAWIGANFNNTTGATGTINNFLITPVLTLSDGDEISFYTRTVAGSDFPDRLEVRLSTDGAGSTNPSGGTDVGSYTILLEEINPNLTVGGYPETWTQFTITLSGIGTDVDSRIAFRYSVTDAGPSGTNSNIIGIDRVVVDEALSIADSNINGFNYFYTPATKNLTLTANDALSSINIFNVLGQEVVAQKLSATNEVINLSSLKNGVYIANVSANGQTTTFKLIKR